MTPIGFLDAVLPALLLAQNGEGDPAGGLLQNLLATPIFPFIVIGVLFYFLLIRPDRRKRAQLSEMLDNLKKNDHVVTVGGIHGVVVNASPGSEDVTIRVDEGSNTKLRIQRSAISRVASDEDDEKKESK
jgi:preprotein translocase subunit YajC